MADNENNKVRTCVNCGHRTQEDDLYCRGCGSIFSAGRYNPLDSHQRMARVYGPPPVKRQHSCKCGFSWISFSMGDREKYCPKCGSECPGKKQGR